MGWNWDGTGGYGTGTVYASVSLNYLYIFEEDNMPPFIYYWVNEQNIIATTGTEAGNAVTLPKGEILTIAVSGSEYNNQRWYVNGVEDFFQTGNTTYIFATSGKEAKRYMIDLTVEKEGYFYSTSFVVTIME